MNAAPWTRRDSEGMDRLLNTLAHALLTQGGATYARIVDGGVEAHTPFAGRVRIVPERIR